MWCEAPAQLLQNLESIFYFEGTRGRGSKPDSPGGKPRQPTHLSVSHIRGEIQRPGQGIEPSPTNIGEKLAWPRAHAASDTLRQKNQKRLFLVTWLKFKKIG